MLNKYARAFFTKVLNPFAAFLLRLGVSPDAVTLVGTAGVVVGALCFYPRGSFFWGTIIITLFIFSDLVDGNMARQSGRTSKFGAFLDSTLDRVGDAVIFGGIAMWYAGKGNDDLYAALAIFCLASGQVVSYTKARAESVGLKCDVNGVVERAERLVIGLFAIGFTGLHRDFGVPVLGWALPIGLWLISVGSLVTVLQRMLTVRREAAEADAAERAAVAAGSAPGTPPASGSAAGQDAAAQQPNADQPDHQKGARA
ncbi:phosphatidylinositol phosphate synthase [Phaeacidiphilus oryzae]|uniref:phosphatidylinositol phosphate synthase n=1 Tax=Phaeacidiphilus oryzae TaxID=348818 RepID=UPI000A028D9F|nr:CDP-alcohol phosphatidyltransferase family protein [Phaeacidiphilus oryzae]